MSDLILYFAQFLYILWPLFVSAALLYSFQGSLRPSVLAKRIHRNLLVTWALLIAAWLVALFSPYPTPTLISVEPLNSILFLGGFAVVAIIEAYRLRRLLPKITARMDLHEVEGLAYLKSLEPGRFEDLVAETYSALGYSARRTGKSGDHGVDVEVTTPEGRRWVVQCKRYRDTVGESVVRELYGTMVSERADRAVLVTSANITAAAESWARGKPIDLVDGPAFLKLIRDARQHASGTAFDRFVNWLETRLLSRGRQPAGLRLDAKDLPLGGKNGVVSAGALNGMEAADPVGQTQPVRLARRCPNCGGRLVPRPIYASDRPGRARALLRCSNYPACRVVVEEEKM